MDKIKKDFIVIYLARNLLATFAITVFSFVYDITNYYNMLPLRAFIKIFADNFYTTAYFLLLWILNYLLFEIYKIVMDALKDRNKNHGKLVIKGKEMIAYGSIISIVILVILLIIDFNQLFKLNFILLVIFMLLRSIKEEFKQRKNRL